MSKNISHNITAALGLRLSFHAGAGLTHSDTDPDKDKFKPVKISADKTVVLCEDDDIPVGSIVLTEPDDGQSVKVTVELGPVVRFNLGEGVTGSTLIGKSVVADGDGGVKLATTDGLGRVTSVEGDKVFVLVYGPVISNA